MDTTNPNAITKQVQLLETITHNLAEAYRSDLEKGLGEPLKLGKLTQYDWASFPEDHFYTLRVDNAELGIILPISKQAVLGTNIIKYKKLVGSASKILMKRGYSVISNKSAKYNRVEIAQQQREIKDP